MDSINTIKTAIIRDDNYLEHEGMPRRSGRYKWGSGKNPAQHNSGDFLSRVEELKSKGWTETTENIRQAFGISSGAYYDEKGKCNTERRMLNIQSAKSMNEDLGPHPLTGNPQYSAIGRKLGVNESTVRGWLKPESEAKTNQAREVADFIKKQIDERGMIDVGPGVDAELGVTYTKLNRALSLLQDEGYVLVSGGVKQVTNPGQQTTQRIICPPDTPIKVNDKGKTVSAAIYDFANVHSLTDYHSEDGGATFTKFVYPKSMDSKRMRVRYDTDKDSDGTPGIAKDGIIEIRRGVPDLSLGNSHYSQVRILVDDTHYLKGMAVYSDKMPPGVDIVFNTNKAKDKSLKEVIKPINLDDPDNPFGSSIKAGGQSYYTDKNGKKQLSLINKRADEGDWTEWKDALPAQFLSKQSKALATQQLALAKENKLKEYNDIMALDNPTIKKHLLRKFADECDSSAVHLQAAALPGQKYHVIIPINTLKETEVYAPGYDNGTKLALIRYPHGGTFEIPILTVNNKNKLGNELIGNVSRDGIGITKKVADRLSGADFDGDTVMAIPTHDALGKVKITSTKELDGLIGYDPKDKYATFKGDDGEYYNKSTGAKIILMKNEKTKTDNTQTEMGRISNLITDMTLAGANEDELAAAVRHSMTVIDAGKHKLDYKQSALDNKIKQLKKTYQRTILPDGTVKIGSGASTIISRASSKETVAKRQGTPKINKKGTPWYDSNIPEGSYIYKTADVLSYTVPRVNKRTGVVTEKTMYKTSNSTKMAEVQDANDLVSIGRHPMELIYANYANDMKNIARTARLDFLDTGKIAYDKGAAYTYKNEVLALKDKITNARLNKPKEREALRRANVEVEAKKAAVLESTGAKMKTSDVKKISQAAITKYRSEVGSESRSIRNIDITDREWEAIQSGAVSEKTLSDIMDNTDIAQLRQRAMPKEHAVLSDTQVSRAKSLADAGYSLSVIADKLNQSPSTISQYLKGV